MPRCKKQPLIGEGMNANLLKQFIDLSYKGNTSIAPEGYTIDAPLSDSRVKVYTKNGSNDKNVVVTHRGSVGLDDWWDNAKYMTTGKVKGTKTYNLHRERHKKAVEKYGAKNIIAIGHSRAGLYLQELQKEFPIKENITYNKASGFHDIGRENDPNQTDVRVGNDFVSLLAPLQKRPTNIVNISGTKNPLDFNAAHQSSQIDKLGTTFVGKKEEMEGSGAMPKRRTLEQLQKLLKKYEKRNTNLEKGVVYKTITIEQNDYDLYNTRRRIKNYEEKGEDLLETKKRGWNDTYKIKKPKKEEPKKEEPKKEEPKKEEPKKIKLAPLQEIPEFKPKKEEPKKNVAFPTDLEGKTKTAKPKKEAPKEEEKAFKTNYFYDLPEDLQNEIRNKIVPDKEEDILVSDIRIPHRGVMRSYKIDRHSHAYMVYKKGDKRFIKWVGVKTLVMPGASAKYIVNEFRTGPRPIPSNFRFSKWNETDKIPITEWNEIQKQSTEPTKSYEDFFFPPKKKKGQPLYKTAKAEGSGFNKKQLTQIILDKNKVIADLEETAYGGNYDTHSYLDNIIDNDTTSQNLIIHSFKSKPKYIQSLTD